jgi:hypothetical protein
VDNVPVRPDVIHVPLDILSDPEGALFEECFLFGRSLDTPAANPRCATSTVEMSQLILLRSLFTSGGFSLLSPKPRPCIAGTKAAGPPNRLAQTTGGTAF